MARSAFAAIALLFLAGCASPDAHLLVTESVASASADSIAGAHRIHIATTRAKSARPGEFFDGDRSDVLAFARVEVTVPATHVTGALERPRDGRRDPSKHFNARDVRGYDTRDAFEAVLRQSIAAKGGRALIFIHGYNTRFDDAVYRLTQIVHDADYSGAPVLFTWASRGRTVDYIYDRDSSTAARDELEDVLRMVARLGAARVDVIAHSMGNWVTLEALRQLALSGDRDLDGRLGDVVLASPDVDVDVFKSQMKRYGTPDKPFFVLLSRNDRALNISGWIAGNRPRLGEYSEAEEIAGLGLIVVNLTDVKAGDSFNHTKFADNPVLVKLLGDRLRAGDTLTEAEADIGTHIEQLAQSLGQTAISAASIVVTTPAAVIGAAAGQ